MATEKQKRAIRVIKSKFKEYTGTYLYLIRCNEYYKIGIAWDIDNRLNSLQCGNPYELELICAYKITDARECEELFKEVFKDKKHIREWFKLSNKDVEIIKKLVD